MFFVKDALDHLFPRMEESCCDVVKHSIANLNQFQHKLQQSCQLSLRKVRLGKISFASKLDYLVASDLVLLVIGMSSITKKNRQNFLS